ncbi:MAG TPA: hypothetical protein VEU62_23675, partial [Bryobacterales bacterium]|nr:hypothetical protein [Bryobacterales bacterium]
SGAGTFAFAFRRSHPYLTGYTIDHAHCEYLETAVEWGIPAVVLLAALAAAGLWRLMREAKAAEGMRGAIGAGCLAGVCAVLLHGLVDFPLRIPAVLVLVAVLAGMAAAALPAQSEPAPATRWKTAALAAGSAVLAVLVVRGLPSGWNAEAHYREAGRSFLGGRFAEAAAADRRALADCPYAAAAWNDLALAAEAQGNRVAAIEASDRALALEPHTRRIEWSAANLRLRGGDVSGALALFGALAAHTPELRRPVWQICWDAGVPPALILDRTAGRGAGGLGEYLQYLVSQGRPEAAVDACTRSPQAGELPPETLRAVFDGLFFAGQSERALRLWQAIGGRAVSFANGNLASPPRGWGLDWAVRPSPGIVVERRRDETGYRLEIEFRQPQNIEYGGVTHDFAVIPGREYRLILEAAAAGIGSSSGVHVEVISPRRRLAVSEPFRRAVPWTTVELRFRPMAGDRICRLQVFRAAAASFDNRISGRFSLRRVSLEPLARSAARRFSPGASRGWQ